MKKILVIVDDFMGGAGNIAQLLAQNLRDQGFIVVMLLTNMNSSPRYKLEDIEVFKGSKAKTKSKIIRFFRSFSLMNKDISEIRPDLIISFLDVNNILSAHYSLKHKIPIIVNERSNPILIKPDLRWVYLRRYYYRKANYVTVQFDCFRRFDNSRFINNCVTINNMIMKPPKCKTDYTLIKKNEFRIVSIGRLHKIKNYADMVKIIYELRNRNINAYLDIFGDGQEKNNIIKFCDSLGLSDYVVLRGNTNNVYNELINHDVFIMTSVQEGFPNSLSEAMAVGLPSLSYLCHNGFKDLISDGNDGYLIPYGDIEHFVDVLVELYKSRELRKKIGEESKKIQLKFSQEKIMKDWNSLISKLV